MATKCNITNKIRHPTRDEANTVMIRVKRNPKDVQPVRIYFCDHCRGWHLTSHAVKEKVREVKLKSLFEKYIEKPE